MLFTESVGVAVDIRVKNRRHVAHQDPTQRKGKLHPSLRIKIDEAVLFQIPQAFEFVSKVLAEIDREAIFNACRIEGGVAIDILNDGLADVVVARQEEAATRARRFEDDLADGREEIEILDEMLLELLGD